MRNFITSYDMCLSHKVYVERTLASILLASHLASK